MEKEKPFGVKNKQGPQQKPGQDHRGPMKPPKDQSQKRPSGPGERSDEESIGRPVQLDKRQAEAAPDWRRPPGRLAAERARRRLAVPSSRAGDRRAGKHIPARRALRVLLLSGRIAAQRRIGAAARRTTGVPTPAGARRPRQARCRRAPGEAEWFACSPSSP